MSHTKPLLGYWLPFVGWRLLPTETAVELGLDQATRWEWWIFSIEWLNRGVALVARPGKEI